MKEPVDHILRPTVPWNTDDAQLTECGLAGGAVKTITRENFFCRLVEYGKVRTAMITCMTCYETAQRWKTWEQDPVQAIQRELAWASRGRTNSIRHELLAIAELIKMHKEEFEGLVMTEEFKAMEAHKGASRGKDDTTVS